MAILNRVHEIPKPFQRFDACGTPRCDKPLNHQNRAKRRYGHLPGHVRDAFLEAVEAFEDWDPAGSKPPARVGYEIRHRPRQISVAEACGLVWGCTDILPGMVYRTLTEDVELDIKRQTYAAAARAMLQHLKNSPSGMTADADQRIKRLYDKRDELWDRLEIMIGVRDVGKPPAELDQLERARVKLMADRAIEALEGTEGGLKEPLIDAIDRALDRIVRMNFEEAARVHLANERNRSEALTFSVASGEHAASDMMSPRDAKAARTAALSQQQPDRDSEARSARHAEQGGTP